MNMMKYDAGTGELKNWLIQENAFDERYLGKCEAILPMETDILVSATLWRRLYRRSKKYIRYRNV